VLVGASGDWKAVISQTDIKEAEEAIGLVKAIDYTIIPIQDDLNIIDPDSTPLSLIQPLPGVRLWLYCS
jgi:hypothetical protein